MSIAISLVELKFLNLIGWYETVSTMNDPALLIAIMEIHGCMETLLRYLTDLKKLSYRLIL